jgi:tetratricopeptide (TPR) repeat protein
MTNRTRNHALEERSLAFLREIFPDSWLVHTYTKEYGIDVQIEVFAENGERTGIRFYGQVKATDKTIEDDVLSLDQSHFDYWSNHTDPVALFRYFEATKELRWCWLHDVEWQLKPQNSSLNVAPLLSGWYKDTSPSEIEQYLHVRKQALFARLIPPYKIAVTHITNKADRTAEIASLISQALSSKSFRVLPKAIDYGHFQISISADKLAAAFSGLPGFVFHFKKIADDQLIACSLLAVFFTACKYERILIARSLATNSIGVLYEAAGEVLRQPLLEALVFALGIEHAVLLVTPMLERESQPLQGWILLFLACTNASWRYGETHSWIKQIKLWQITPPFSGNDAAFSYNLAKALSEQGEDTDAIDSYMSALAEDDSYAGRPYFWTDLGACHFESRAFRSAAECYEKSILLEDTASTRWRLAEVLFNLGEYRRAHDLLEAAMPDVEISVRNYVQLLLCICRELIDVWGLEKQDLVDFQADEYSQLDASPCANEQQVIARLRPFMAKNAIDCLSAFNAGIFARRSGQNSIAMYRFFACAIRQRHDVEAWRNAMSCAALSNDVELMLIGFEQAYYYTGTEFLPWALGMLTNLPLPRDALESWEQLVMQIVEVFESARDAEIKSGTLRIHSSSGTKEFRLDSS